MLFVLSSVALHQRNIEGIHINRGAKPIGEDVAAELASVVDAEHAFLVLGVDCRTGLLCHMLHCY